MTHVIAVVKSSMTAYPEVECAANGQILPDGVVAIRGARIAISSHDQAQKLYD